MTFCWTIVTPYFPVHFLATFLTTQSLVVFWSEFVAQEWQIHFNCALYNFPCSVTLFAGSLKTIFFLFGSFLSYSNITKAPSGNLKNTVCESPIFRHFSTYPSVESVMRKTEQVVDWFVFLYICMKHLYSEITKTWFGKRSSHAFTAAYFK